MSFTKAICFSAERYAQKKGIDIKSTILLFTAIMMSLASCFATEKEQTSKIDQSTRYEFSQTTLPAVGTTLEDAKQIMLSQGFSWEIKPIVKLDGTPVPDKRYATCAKPNNTISIYFRPNDTVSNVNIYPKSNTIQSEQTILGAIYVFQKNEGRYPNSIEELTKFILTKTPHFKESNLENMSLKMTSDRRCMLILRNQQYSYQLASIK
jgi:hypothetical protein